MHLILTDRRIKANERPLLKPDESFRVAFHFVPARTEIRNRENFERFSSLMLGSIDAIVLFDVN